VQAVAPLDHHHLQQPFSNQLFKHRHLELTIHQIHQIHQKQNRNEVLSLITYHPAVCCDKY